MPHTIPQTHSPFYPHRNEFRSKPKTASHTFREDVHAVEVVQAHIFRGKTGKTPNRTENPILYLPKTGNRERNRTETANRNRCRNRKTDVFWYKNRKADLKNGRNRKTDNRNAPSRPASVQKLKLKNFSFKISPVRKISIKRKE